MYRLVESRVNLECDFDRYVDHATLVCCVCARVRACRCSVAVLRYLADCLQSYLGVWQSKMAL